MPLSLKTLTRTPVLGLFCGPGQHRIALLRAPSDRAPIFPPATAGVVRHEFRPCKQCGTDTAAILHREGYTCSDCGREHYTDEDGDQ